MEGSILLGLLYNTAILLSFSMLYDYSWVREKHRRTTLYQLGIGVVAGGIGILLMMTPWILLPGIVFDTRSVLLSMSGLYLGVLPTLVAMLFTLVCRLIMGGDGVWMGVSVIVMSGTAGLLWRYFRPHWSVKHPFRELLILGFVVHLLMLFCTILLPKVSFLQSLQTILLPILTLYPIATLLLGSVMLHQLRNWQNRKAADELILAKERAEESDRLKTAFLQNLSHEIRTPLNAIMGFSSLMPEAVHDPDALALYARMVRKGGEDLLEMINDILDISKIESGQLELRLSPCNLGRLMDEAAEFAMAIRERKGREAVCFSLQIDDAFRNVTFTTDQKKWRQILHNLLGNAFKFTLQGRVELGCRPDEKGVPLFYVLDTGVGIPSSKQSIIFNRFVQLHYGHPDFGSGTGLGLSIVQGLIDLFEGSVWLESEPGKGTIVYFSFPGKYFRLS